jgi:hypothetical protein
MRRMNFLPVLFIGLLLVAGCSGSPQATVVAPGQVTVTVSPGTASLQTFGKQPFMANVTGATNTAVTWEVNGVAGGNATTGTISSTGMYSAPHFVSGTIIPANGPTTVTIKAVSQASATSSGSATVTLEAQGQTAESGAVELGSSGGNTHASSQSGNTITCCGGTLGSLLNRNGSLFILSNNHVLADSDAGASGDAILQPGLVDTGTCTSTGATTVANLSQFFTLEGNPANPVDAAIAAIVAGKVNTSGDILLLGSGVDANNVPLAGAPLAGSGILGAVNDPVAKSGRSSGLTCSTIGAVNAAFSVQYQRGCGTGAMFTVQYNNQISVNGGTFSAEGDSGSLIVRQDTANPVALLFAGSDTDTVGTPIGTVLQAMADQSNHVPTVVGGSAHQVFGCTIPAPTNATTTLPTVAVAKEAMQTAAATRDTNASKLLGMTGIRGVGVGASLDHQGQPAVLLFVDPGTAHSGLPAQVDGVRTRIVETSGESARGILSEDESRPMATQEATFAVTSLSTAEMARAKAAHSAHVEEWMKKAGVQGFGISSSADSAGESSLMIFLIRGAAHEPIPPVIDGVRTRVRESSRFHAGFINAQPRPACTVSGVKAKQLANVKTSLAPKS